MREKFFVTAFYLLMKMCAVSQIYCGHSHNDYLQKKPLAEALRYGYKSIEIDVWWHKGNLVISHTKFGLDKKPTIDSLYFHPLAEMIKKNRGKLYSHSDTVPLILMIDVKNQPTASWARLKECIEPYKHLFCKWQGDSLVEKGWLSLLISGSVARSEISSDSIRIANIDGRISDTAQIVSNVLVPRISIPWKKYFLWNGAGEMPKEEMNTLKSLVEKVHMSGKTIRFWGAPDNYGIWKTLLSEGVDWINTEQLKAFADFYQRRK
jgi:alkaline phosphatase